MITKPDFIASIENSTSHRPIRDYISECIFNDPSLLSELMQMALDVNNKNHYKACWILELVLEKHIEWLKPYCTEFCAILPFYLHDGALRSVSKICLFAAIEHLKSNEQFLDKNQVTVICECSFDWLITNQKVAAKAYAMRTLFELGKLQSWIYPELRIVLEQGYPNHSAAYKAASKDVLRRMK